MRVTYDAEANAAYLYVVDVIAEGQADSQHHSIVTPNQGEITLDYDSDGHLLGIEVLFADAVLPAELLRQAPPPAPASTPPANT